MTRSNIKSEGERKEERKYIITAFQQHSQFLSLSRFSSLIIRFGSLPFFLLSA